SGQVTKGRDRRGLGRVEWPAGGRSSQMVVFQGLAVGAPDVAGDSLPAGSGIGTVVAPIAASLPAALRKKETSSGEQRSTGAGREGRSSPLCSEGGRRNRGPSW